jgi:hypothetical protein
MPLVRGEREPADFSAGSAGDAAWRAGGRAAHDTRHGCSKGRPVPGQPPNAGQELYKPGFCRCSMHARRRLAKRHRCWLYHNLSSRLANRRHQSVCLAGGRQANLTLPGCCSSTPAHALRVQESAPAAASACISFPACRQRCALDYHHISFGCRPGTNGGALQRTALWALCRHQADSMHLAADCNPNIGFADAVGSSPGGDLSRGAAASRCGMAHAASGPGLAAHRG